MEGNKTDRQKNGRKEGQADGRIEREKIEAQFHYEQFVPSVRCYTVHRNLTEYQTRQTDTKETTTTDVDVDHDGVRPRNNAARKSKIVDQFR